MVVTNLVSAVDTVFEELNLDLLLLLLLILPLPFISPQQYCHSLQREQEATIGTIKMTSFEGNCCWRRRVQRRLLSAAVVEVALSLPLELAACLFVLRPINDFKISQSPFFSQIFSWNLYLAQPSFFFS